MIKKNSINSDESKIVFPFINIKKNEKVKSNRGRFTIKKYIRLVPIKGMF